MSSATVRVVISVASGSLALCFNSLLACIILTTKCFYIGNYKFLLFLYTVSAATYSIGQITTAATFILLPDGYMLYDTVRLLPVTIGYVSINIYIFCFVQNIVILTLSFSYRYFVICYPRGLEILINNWIPIAIVSLGIIMYTVGALVYAIIPTAKCEELFEEAFYQATRYRIQETAYDCGMVFYHGQLNWILFAALGSFTVVASVAAGIIITVALRTTRKLKTISAESQAMANQQKKIFTLLIFQVSLPWIFNIVPVQFALISSYFALPTDALVQSTGCFLTIAQIIDPILIFYFIKPYRRALWRKGFQARVSSTGESHTGHYQQRTSHTIGHSNPL